MIRYSLICEHEHDFEGWFRDSAAFDAQVKAGEIACPTCGSVDVDKALMAPAVSTRKDATPTVPVASADPSNAEVREVLHRLKKHVVDNSEYVGEKFPEEARKIHYEEADNRAIYGEASVEDAKSLIDEGIEVAPLPILPEERN